MPIHIAGAPSPPADPYDADVVILALDRAEETLAAIRSALEQTGVFRHVVIVDQGSASATLARFASSIAGRNDATLLRLARNAGVAGGRNAGSAFGHGRHIVALDNDAIFSDASVLAGAVAALDDDPDLAAIGFRILTYTGGDGDRADDLSSWGYPRALLARAAECFDVATFVGCGHAIRRAAWEQAGGYDQALFFCWEEFDFCLRAISLGWRIVYRGDLSVRHKVSGERRFEWSGRRWFYFVRNRLYIGRKCGQSWLTMGPRFAAYLLKGARHGLLRQTLRALPAAVRLSRSAHARNLSPSARAYLARTDAAHRGGLFTRVRREVLADLVR